MSSPAEPQKSRVPSLRIREIAIENFRTFRSRTVVPFHGGTADVDAIATFHGDNGAGKSNAIAALDAFFYLASYCLRFGGDACDVTAPWDKPVSAIAGHVLLISYRDRAAGAGDQPTTIEVNFADSRLPRMRMLLVPSGNEVRAQLQWWSTSKVVRKGKTRGRSPAQAAAFRPVPTREQRDQLLTLLEAPMGPGSQPIAVVDSRRRALWLNKVPGKYSPHASLLSPTLAEQLFTARTSLLADVRNRWRQFVGMLQTFGPFKKKDISIDRISPNEGAPPTLTIEDRGTVVLALDELSSGEQQILVLCADVMLARASIFVIMEPELSLDAKNQRLLRDVFELALEMGWVEQIIIESHVPSFDGPDVIRFRRGADGATEVTREPSATEAQRELAQRAQERGAKPRWVTAEGYTQLPEIMIEDLKLHRGGHVWFLRGPSRWEAWPEGDLSEVLGDPGESQDE